MNIKTLIVLNGDSKLFFVVGSLSSLDYFSSIVKEILRNSNGKLFDVVFEDGTCLTVDCQNVMYITEGN